MICYELFRQWAIHVINNHVASALKEKKSLFKEIIFYGAGATNRGSSKVKGDS